MCFGYTKSSVYKRKATVTVSILDVLKLCDPVSVYQYTLLPNQEVFRKSLLQVVQNTINLSKTYFSC